MIHSSAISTESESSRWRHLMATVAVKLGVLGRKMYRATPLLVVEPHSLPTELLA